MRNENHVASCAEDDAIIKRTLNGERDAFGLLIQKYKDSLFDMACRILGNRAEAEDVLQDAFVEAYRHLSEFHHKARFSTWVYSIVLNRVRNNLRHNKVIRWYPLEVRYPDQDEYRTPEMPERSPAIPMVMEHKLELENVQKEVHRLPALYQTIFILHYFQDLPLDEVAGRLDRPLGTIKVYLHRARKLLYKRLRNVDPNAKQSSEVVETRRHAVSAGR